MLRTVVLAPLALVFLAFGTFMMVVTYHQDNLIVFLALFFSSSLIVLLSLACLAGIIFRTIRPLGPEGSEASGADPDGDDLP